MVPTPIPRATMRARRPQRATPARAPAVMLIQADLTLLLTATMRAVRRRRNPLPAVLSRSVPILQMIRFVAPAPATQANRPAARCLR